MTSAAALGSHGLAVRALIAALWALADGLVVDPPVGGERQAAPLLGASTNSSISAASFAVRPETDEVAAPRAGASIVSELRRETAEVKQHRANIIQMQQALTADVALLRESSALQRASATHRSQVAARSQVRKAEKLVKDLSAMLRDSHAEAVEDANSLLHEADEIRKAADSLASEASAQLSALAPKSAHHRLRRADSAQDLSDHAQAAEPTAPAVEAPPAKGHANGIFDEDMAELDVDDIDDES